MTPAENLPGDTSVHGDWIIRDHSGEGDLASIVQLHQDVYGPEYRFDDSFSAYVREPLAVFLKEKPTRGRLWIAERGSRIAACIALVEVSPDEAQLRWFAVSKENRGRGLGGRLMAELLGFAKERGYRTVFLWTVDLLSSAARVYARAGFTLVESVPRQIWGRELVEQKMALNLRS